MTVQDLKNALIRAGVILSPSIRELNMLALALDDCVPSGKHIRWRFIPWRGFRHLAEDFSPHGKVTRLWLGFILITIMDKY